MSALSGWRKLTLEFNLAAVEIQVIVQKSNVISCLVALLCRFLGVLSLIGILAATLTVQFASKRDRTAYTRLRLFQY